MWSSYLWNLQTLEESRMEAQAMTAKDRLEQLERKFAVIVLRGRLKFLASFWFQLSIYVIYLLASVAVVIAVHFRYDAGTTSTTDPYGCPSTQAVVAIAQGGLALFLLVVTFSLLWNTNDKLFIKRELEIGCAVGSVVLVFWGVGIFTGTLPVDVLFGLVILLIIVLHIISVVIPTIMTFKINNRYNKRMSIRSLPGFHKNGPCFCLDRYYAADEELMVETLTTKQHKDQLGAVLEHPVLLASLEEFCVKSFCIEK